MRNKVVEPFVFAENQQASLISVTGIWLSDDDHMPRVVLGKFALCRQDRMVKLSGGGVATIVRECVIHLESRVTVH